MLIRCPTCSSGYDLDPALLADGRILRCAHCRDAWVFRAAGGVEISAEARFGRASSEAEAERPPRGCRPPRPSRRPSAAAAAAAVLATLFGGGAAAVAAKARVVAAFPPSEAVFATLGLPVNLAGLSLGEIRSTVVSGDGPPVLTLEGRITNLRHEATAVPPLRIAVRDSARRELYYWTAPAPKAELAPGEAVPFRSRLSGPPRDGQELAVSFAEGPPAPRRLAEVLPSDR